MGNVQSQFKKFHDNIKLGYQSENANLREKRDIILDKLKQQLKKQFEDKDESPPQYTPFIQGSYALGTGVKPSDDDYDIDVGLLFQIAKSDYSDPTEPKKWVFDALNGHTKSVVMKKPCITVHYQKADEPLYHVDLVVYSDKESNWDQKTYIAKGKSNGSQEEKYWENADPKRLNELFKDRWSGKDDKQFRRVIRYLKHWKNQKFSSSGNEAPLGIGITVAAYNWFEPEFTMVDVFANKTRANDLLALKKVVTLIIGNFSFVTKDDEYQERLQVDLPVVPFNDLFERMTKIQMETFKEKLEKLEEQLVEAEEKIDPVEASEILQKAFGDKFPIPSEEKTGKKMQSAIIGHSESA